MYGPPDWDWSNKARVNRDLAQQNKSKSRKMVYFSEWGNTGDWMRKSQKLKTQLYREGMEVLNDLKGELRAYQEWDGMGRKAASRLYLELSNPDGRHTDRPFFHIVERGTRNSSLFKQINYRSGYSDSAWGRYLAKRNKFEGGSRGKGSYPKGETRGMDRVSIRDRVLARYFTRNPDAYRYGKL